MPASILDPPSVKVKREANRARLLCTKILADGETGEPIYVCRAPTSVASREGGARHFLQLVASDIDRHTGGTWDPLGYTLFMCSARAGDRCRRPLVYVCGYDPDAPGDQPPGITGPRDVIARVSGVAGSATPEHLASLPPSYGAPHNAGSGFFVRIDGVASAIPDDVPAIPMTEDEHERDEHERDEHSDEHGSTLSQLAMNAMEQLT